MSAPEEYPELACESTVETFDLLPVDQSLLLTSENPKRPAEKDSEERSETQSVAFQFWEPIDFVYEDGMACTKRLTLGFTEREIVSAPTS